MNKQILVVNKKQKGINFQKNLQVYVGVIHESLQPHTYIRVHLQVRIQI